VKKEGKRYQGWVVVGDFLVDGRRVELLSAQVSLTRLGSAETKKLLKDGTTLFSVIERDAIEEPTAGGRHRLEKIFEYSS
jgi:hypothetical protein